MHRFALPAILLTVSSVSTCFAALSCDPTAVPPIVRAEGLSERVSDISMFCSGGAPGQLVSSNLTVFLSVNVTNRLSGPDLTGIQFTIDNGTGPQPAGIPAFLTGANSFVYNGLSFHLSSTGTATLRLVGIRAAAFELKAQPGAAIQAFLAINGVSQVPLTNPQLAVAVVQPGLYAGNSSILICSQFGSAVPSGNSFAGFLSSGAAFASQRVTEGFADAFAPLGAPASLNADTGTRILVTYSGFPASAQVYVPDVVAGSDAIQPTGGGDFGVPASGGAYAPGAHQSLLLARVRGAASDGSGGVPVYLPAAPGSGTVSFDTVNPVALTNGSGYLVYEVVDANPNTFESAQFPTFLSLPANSVTGLVNTSQSVTLAPVSTVMTATATDPIPRFEAVTPSSDCNIVGDCNANYFPRMWVDSTPITYTAQQGSSYQVAYTRVVNNGGGVLEWATSVTYQNGSGWLRVDPTSGIGTAGIRIDALPGTLTPGTYQASLLVYSPAIGGEASVPITLTITAAPPPPVLAPAIQGVVNAASFAAGPVSPGSLAAIMGTNFSGQKISVAFNGLDAPVLFSNATQINLLVPSGLASQSSAQVVVTVDGVASAAGTVALASMSPAIFAGGILNQDSTVNSAAHPAQPGSVIQIFATGLSGPGAITAQIDGQPVPRPYYGGPAPGLSGVQQVDLILPTNVTGKSTGVAVCGNIGAEVVCSPVVQVALGQ